MGTFAIDRLRAKQNGEELPAVLETKPKPKHEHIWLYQSDGHNKYWYECERCMDIRYWLPTPVAETS